MAHNFHPRTHDIEDITGSDPVFFDGCEDCERKAKEPLLCSIEVAAAMVRKMYAVEYANDGRYRSDAEAVAGGMLYRMSVWLQRNAGLEPGELVSMVWARARLSL